MQPFFFILRLSLAVVLSCYISHVAGQAPTAGYTRAEAATDENGRGHLFIPLNLPKGTFVQPSLTLSYNSSGEMADFSLGDLFQAITRTPANYSTDGFFRAIEMDKNDRYALNGEPLKANFCCHNSPGGYLTFASDFRTEQETFTRVVPHVSYKAGYGYAADSFTVYTKSGLIMTFGGSTNSKLPGIWLLNKIMDRNGNYLTITYTINTVNNEYQPAYVDYTGNAKAGLAPYNKIVFQYENRPDTVAKYFAGLRSITTKRLSQIIAYDHNQLYRRYKLDYMPGNGISRVNKVTEWGTDNTTYLKPVTIIWSAQPAIPGFTKTGSGNWVGIAPGTGGIFTADLNGDSRADLISYAGSGKYNVSLSTGSGFKNEVWTGNVGGTANIIADVNGDMLADLIYVSNNKFYVSISTGKGFQTSEWSGGNASGLDKFVACDVNNDGRNDLCRNGGNGKFIFNISTGTSFQVETRTTSYAGFTGTPFVADLNSDGASDVFFKQNADNWQIIMSSGSSYWTAVWKGPAEDMSKCMLADMNNDNLIDIISKSNSTDGIWNIFFSTARGFVYRKWNGPVGGLADVKIADVDKNGFPDIIKKQNTAAFNVWLNKGYVLENSSWQSPSIKANDYILLDLDGDGGIDVLSHFSSNSWTIGMSNATKDLVTKVVNGNGQSFSFTYEPLTNATVYTKGNTATYPLIDLCAPFYVVRSFTTDNGAGGLRTVNFHYKQGKFHLKGRGFRGFEVVTASDAVANTVLTTTYSTDHRLIAVRMLKEELRTMDGKLLQLTEYQTAINSYKLPVDSAWYSYTSRKTERFYELNGVEYKNKTTDYAVDAFGNPVSVTETWSNGYKVITNNLYYNDIFNWSISKLLETSVIKTMPGQASNIRNTLFTYDAANNLIKEVLLPAHPTRRLQMDYTVDKFGNRISETTSGAGISTRTNITQYDIDGRNIIYERNALGHVKQQSYKNGLPASLTNENGLVIPIGRDAFGRETMRSFPDGTYEFTQFNNCPGQGCVAGAVYYIETQMPGKPTEKVFYNMMDRVIRKESENFDGRKIVITINYNADGTVKSQSDPYFEGSAIRWNNYSYDAIKRLVTEIAPGNRTTTYTYNGLTRTITDAEGKKKTLIENPQGKPVTSIDHLGNQLQFQYDSDLNITRMSGPKGYVVSFTYDVLGFKNSINDPSVGMYRYECNALGKLTKQINAANEAIVFQYDLLDRVSRRIEPGTDTRYEYDGPNGKSNLARVYVNNMLTESRTYHPNGKLYQHTLVRNGISKSYTYFYNSLSGMLETIVYPNNYSIRYIYTKGYLTEVRTLVGGALLWKSNSYNEDKTLTSFTLGNNITTVRQYDVNTRSLSTIQTRSSAAGPMIQNLQYFFSATHNLTERRDLSLNLKETFQYDGLNRLVKAQVNQQTPLTMAYDELGNITFKSDVGYYKYGENGAGPQTLTSIDHAGINCAYQLQQEISYTAFNYVSRIRSRDTEINFTYWPDRSRQSMTVMKSWAVKMEKNYYGDLYEEVKDSTGATTINCYIKANAEVVAVVSMRGADQKTTYIHTDHLGSVNVYTSQTGQVLEKISFDIWGKRRNPTNWASFTGSTAMSSFQKGYTFHEQLYIDELVFTPARIYNPILARFISADPFVQDITDLQQLNRFSYVENNPGSNIDPSGFFLKKLFKKFIGIVVGLVVSTLLPPAAGFFSAILSGAVSGFSMAFTHSLVNGAGLVNAFHAGLRASLFGGIKEGLTFGIGYALPVKDFSKAPIAGEIKAVIHGVSQGAINHAQGGSFGQGFARGFIGENLRFARDEFVQWRESKYGNLTEEQLERAKATYRTANDYPEDGKNLSLIEKSKYNIIRDPDYPNVGISPVNDPGLISVAENGRFMQWIAKNIPGMNSMAVAHDYFSEWAGSKNVMLDYMIKVPTIVPFVVMQYGALHTSMYNNGRIY